MVRWLTLILPLIFTACTSTNAAGIPYLNLDEREPLPAVAAAKIVPLRVAVAAILSPQGTSESYSDLAAYLGRKLDRPTQIVQRRTYAEVNQLVAEAQVDLAFVCTSAYIAGHAEFGMTLLVAPEIGGKSVYNSVLIVPADSKATSMADLEGSVFAFTDPMSFSGRTYPTYLVQQLGKTPDSFFRRTFFTYSHDKAIQAVAADVADGAAVDSLVLDYALRRTPSLAQHIRTIYRSPDFGIPPVVVPPGLPLHQKIQLQDVLLGMDNDSKGRQVLAEMGIDRFIHLDDKAYADARTLVQETGARVWEP